MQRITLFSFIFICLFLSFSVKAQEDTTRQSQILDSMSVQVGKELFVSCAACHAIDKKVIGPALKDVTQKYEEAWLIRFIRNSQALIKQGDPQALAVYNDYNQLIMPNHDFSDTEIRSILDYITNESRIVATQSSQKEIISRPKLPLKVYYRPLYFKDQPVFWIAIALITTFLVLILLFIIKISNIIRSKKKNIQER